MVLPEGAFTTAITRCGGRYVDVVHTHAGSPNDPQLRGAVEQLGEDVGGTSHDQGRSPPENLGKLGLSRVMGEDHFEPIVVDEFRQTTLRHLVSGQDCESHRNESEITSSSPSSSSSVWSPM